VPLQIADDADDRRELCLRAVETDAPTDGSFPSQVAPNQALVEDDTLPIDTLLTWRK
jgi:hypothetical protein